MFVRHTDDAEEVDEDTFFHDTRSGGTVVLSALELADEDPPGALCERMERLHRPGVRRRRVRRRSGTQRPVPARASAAGRALHHLSRDSGPRRTRSEQIVAVGRVRARCRAARAISRCSAHRSATRSIRSSASCSARRPAHERASHFATAPTGTSTCSSATTLRSPASRPEFGLDTYPNQIEIITSEQMLDAYAAQRAADRLSALVLRQGIHPQRAGVSPRHPGARLRDRHQLESLHRVPDGREHHDDAGVGDRARVLRPQLVLQGQPPVSAVDGGRRHPRLPGLRAALRHGMRRAARRLRRGRHSGRMPRADAARRRPLSAAERAHAQGRNGPAGRARNAPRAAVQRPVAHASRRRRAQDGRRPEALSARVRRRTSSTSSRSIRPSSNPGSASSSASCASSRSTSTRSRRRR